MSDNEQNPQELNPHYAVVIGFVDANGQLADQPDQQYFNLLINAGQLDEVKENERVLVFALGAEMIDPKTSESLGCFEIVRGYGRVSSVQTKMAVIRSTQTKTVRYQKPINAVNALQLLGQSSEEATREDPAPFKDAKIGDLVRFI